jgi:protocatechuate 3,4-dioxygenase beta subunit
LRKILVYSILVLLLAGCASPTSQPAVEPSAAVANAISLTATSPDVSTPVTATTAPLPAAFTPTSPAASTPAAPAFDCTTPVQLTPALTEGPYYKTGSPERASLLEDGMQGTVLVLSGYILDEQCQPVANAWLDFWQADARGVYDNHGYTLRGHFTADANGAYELKTVLPGEYPGRTEHIHVKVQAPGGPLLTSQLFFPGVQGNDADGIYDARNLIQIQSSSADQITASYNFIIKTS